MNLEWPEYEPTMQGRIKKIQQEGAENILARAQHRSKPTTHEHSCGDCTMSLDRKFSVSKNKIKQ